MAADNRTAASKLVREIEARFETVRDRPEIGSRRDRLAAGLRIHFHRDYALYYRFTDIEVIIVRVMHGARDARALRFGEP
ncbi:type II toxin-antitoxin system RelE/ParE family toxin [Halochromatium glycolicum]|uniref:type II toxin-antitoxin system RelE/ParE family toxin n=1 Tax=Halochromatium glycolicum TaxID=85075 RepID=UPI003B838041